MAKKDPAPAGPALPLARARAHWHRRQHLHAPFPAGLGAMAEATGWLRTLGGAEAYLALRARKPDATKAAIEAAVASLELRVTPAARGCIYLVPRAHAPLALAFAAQGFEAATARDLERAGSSWTEVEAAAGAVLAALAKPLSTDRIRKALPEGAIRSLGEKGKKAGLSSVLPVALRKLEFEGRIERILEDGRLDGERYAWRKVAPGAARGALPKDPAGLRAALAGTYFAQHAPASVRHFAEWAGLTLGDAKAAVEGLALQAYALEGQAEPALVPAADAGELERGPPPGTAIAFLGFADNFTEVRGGPAALIDPAHHGLPVESWGKAGTVPLGQVKHLTYRCFTVGPEVAGFWELDAGAGEVVVRPFARLQKATAAAVGEAARATARFLLDQLGHGRSFSLDTDEAVASRAAALRVRAGGA